MGDSTQHHVGQRSLALLGLLESHSEGCGFAGRKAWQESLLGKEVKRWRIAIVAGAGDAAAASRIARPAGVASGVRGASAGGGGTNVKRY